jgi:hypothetical protein
VEPVGGAFCAPSKDLWETPVCGVFHRSGRIHRPLFEIASPQEAPGATIGEPIDLGHPPLCAGRAVTMHSDHRPVAGRWRGSYRR